MIGSGEKGYSTKNPFTGGERYEMLSALVKDRFDLDKIYISAIPDINRNTIWAANVIDLVPYFEVVFTNNPLVQQLFTNLAKKDVREIPLVNRSEYSGKVIRKMMIDGTKWEENIPEEVVKLINKFDGISRIQTVSKSDEVAEIEHNKA